MDRSLWFLLRLRSWSWLRRWGRNVRTLKGTLLALVGSLVFVPMLFASFFTPGMHGEGQLAQLRRFGPLGLFAYCVLNVLLATGERALYFSPAEIDFLFCGPYRQRQLLLFKVVGSLGVAVLSAAFMTVMLGHHAASRGAAFIGLLLAVELLYLFALAVGIASSTVAALAFDRRRKLALLALGGIALAALLPLGHEVVRLRPLEIFERVESSPVMQAVLLPFRPFTRAFTAERAWPDLAIWGTLALAVDLGLLALVLAIDARYYEAAAASSARVYGRLQRARKGAAWASSPSRARFTLPMLPWWGGVGPNLWRQGITAARDPGRFFALLILFQLPWLSFLLTIDPGETTRIAPLTMVMLLSIATFAPTMVGYDFRLDLERIGTLKTLPIPPVRLVLGQVLTPAAVLTGGEWLTLAVIAVVTRPAPLLVAGVAALLAPANVLLVAAENLFFLWFPTRFVSGPAVDFQTMGRQLLLMFGKFAMVGIVAAVAAAAGMAAYFALDESWTAAVAAAWLAVTAACAASLPLLALAFTQFDVARDTPA